MRRHGPRDSMGLCLGLLSPCVRREMESNPCKKGVKEKESEERQKVVVRGPRHPHKEWWSP